ncbi:glycosyltransferase family 2 protein [Candidatus Bathyarchaeota archaeon]|nr:glycosyltransferase family 2 protein [Candidatus Bathyarchaeota archaeon]
MKEAYDLAVAYRICPRMPSKQMAIYPQDKLRLSEVCLRSFKRSLGSLKVKMWVLLDNCPAEYEALFLKYFDESDLRLIKLAGIGNRATFGLQMESLANQNDAEIVYFAEDDYFFKSNRFVEMIEFLEGHSDVHFVSPYDHPDYYTLDIHKRKYEIREHATHHWRTVAAATLSFLTTKQILAKAKKALCQYSEGRAQDYGIWMSMTKYHVFDPFKTMKYLIDRSIDPFCYTLIRYTWVDCWKQILFGRRWKLWVPMPSIATHMEKRFLAPCVNWEEEFEQERLRKKEVYK